MRAHDIRRLAVEALADPRTVRRYLDGRRVAQMSAQRIEDAMQRLGLTPTSPTASGDAAEAKENDR